jgi:hypothetical protein
MFEKGARSGVSRERDRVGEIETEENRERCVWWWW